MCSTRLGISICTRQSSLLLGPNGILRSMNTWLKSSKKTYEPHRFNNSSQCEIVPMMNRLLLSIMVSIQEIHSVDQEIKVFIVSLTHLSPPSQPENFCFGYRFYAPSTVAEQNWKWETQIRHHVEIRPIETCSLPVN